MAGSSGIDLPEEDFNYDDYVKKEFGTPSPVPRGLHWFWWLVGVLLLLAVLAGWLGFLR